ncbi:hypothetical protein [Staphylococcus shinii]|uniref:hypothetical protein n=1 Tax=Staphylococcus shinii TaxID=2912228 RepID=UPI003F57957C
MKYHDLGRNVASLVGNFEIETQKRLNYWTLEQFNQFYEACLIHNKSYSSNYFSRVAHVKARLERSHRKM